MKMFSYLMRTTKMLKAAKFRMRTTFLTTMKRERMSSTRARVNKLRFQPTRDPSTERRILGKYAIPEVELFHKKEPDSKHEVKHCYRFGLVPET